MAPLPDPGLAAPHTKTPRSPSPEEVYAAYQAEVRRTAIRDIVVGGALCAFGVAITALTFSAAQGGGTYVIAWGPAVFGGFQFLRGLVRLAG